VLRNLLGIKSKRTMDEIEGQSQVSALDRLVRIYDRDHRFTAADVSRIHREWLGEIYPRAGQYRQVNLGKRDFTFAAAKWIPKLMAEFEVGPLAKHTPCRNLDSQAVVHALAVVHTELVLIHPFRDGNGRMASHVGDADGASGRPARPAF
jgi:cell filamentation protein